MIERHDILSALNPEQLQAATHTHGPLKIVAGAGTGKTGTLTTRFAYLVGSGTPPDRILALTFSRRAAGEFRERALSLLDSSYKRLWINTFHGFCLRVLREEGDRFGGFRVMGEPERRRMVARAVRDDGEASGRTYYVGTTGAARLVEDALTLTSRTKDEAISPVDFAEYADRRDVERLRELANVYLRYEDLCRTAGRLDFGDLGFLLIRTFAGDPALLARWRDRFDHLMVDEFQDTNEVQWQLLTLLAPPPHANLTVVGDSCQAIYAFRGASSRFFDRFTEEFEGATSIHLTTNYRSRQRILDVAHALIAIPHTQHDHLFCNDGDTGQPVRIGRFVDEDAEADYVARSILRLTTEEGLAPNDCAVLCRSVRQAARPLARALTAYGIPFYVRGYDPTVEEALDDLRAILRCVSGSAMWPDAARVLIRRQVATFGVAARTDVDREDALARRYAHFLGPNQETLRAVPPLDSLTYGRVTDWLDGSESWRPLDQIRASLPEQFSAAREALERLDHACVWLRGVPLEGQVYAALALVGRLDAEGAGHGWPAHGEGRASISACRRALRAAHGLARAGLGIAELLVELDRLNEEESELGDAGGTGVPILTLHASKGLEWAAVFVVGTASGLLPAPLRLDRAFDLDDLARYVRAGRTGSLAEVAATYGEEPERARAARFMEEERRLAYVGCTRARANLFVTHAASYDRHEFTPSPFLADMQRAESETWMTEGDADAGVLLPLDVARSVRQQALAALGVTGRPVLPRAGRESSGSGGDVVGAVLAAQWTASQVPGGVPIRFRELPSPFAEDSAVSVSFSGVDSYRSCPRQFFYGHVLHVDAPSGGASTTLGNKVHHVLHALNTGWMETGRPPEDTEVQDAWRHEWKLERETVEMAMVDPQTRVPWEPGFVFARQVVQGWRRGAGFLRRYYTWERQRWPSMGHRPGALEHPFLFTHKDHTIDGRIDCIFETPRGPLVVDYKTGKKSSDLKAAQSLQLAIYEGAWFRETGQVPAVAYYLLANDREKGNRVHLTWDSDRQVDMTRYDDGARDALWAQIDEAIAHIVQNEFGAQPVKGKATCERCAYSLWCEESLA